MARSGSTRLLVGFLGLGILFACGEPSERVAAVAPASQPDPGGDCCKADWPPPQLDLVNVTIAVRDGNAEFTWAVGGPLDALVVEPESHCSWVLFLTDHGQRRVIAVNNRGGEVRAWVELPGTRPPDFPRLPAPEFVGNQVRLVASLEALEWDGRGATWFAETSYHRLPESPAMADRTTKRRFPG